MSNGFDKISLDKKISAPDSTGTPNQNNIMAKRKKPVLLKIFLIFIAAVVGISALLYFPVKNLYAQVSKTTEVINRVKQAAENQNIEELQKGLAQSKEQLEVTRKAYRNLGFIGFVPFVGGYYNDGQHGLDAALAGIEAGQISVETLLPYADLLGLKGESTFVSGSADDRIQTAVQTLDKLTPRLGEISQKLAQVQKNLNEINVNRYPEKIGDREVRSQLSSIKTTVDEASTLFINARPLMESLPSILGQPDPKKYLILFQNDKELRPTGGFITAYAIFKLDKGKIIVETADDIYKLDEKNTTSKTPPAPIVNHLKVFKLHLRDANYDPDFIDSMKRFEEIYNSIGGTTKVDGIIAVDTHVLVEAMKILGSIPAYGTKCTVDKELRCICTQIIYELEEYTGIRSIYIKENRKDIIGVLLYQIMQKALGVSPSQYWGQLFQMVLSEFDQKHILVSLKNENAQQSIEALNYAGRMLVNHDGDYLHINDANLGGAKSNLFVKHFITQDYEKGDDGRVIKTVTIEYKNPTEGSPGCNLEAGGLCLNGPMPNWIRIYVPKGSELIEFTDSEDEVIIADGYNKTYFEGFVTVMPASVTQVKVKYKLPKEITGPKVNLYMQKQAGTEGHEITLKVNGKDREIFNLIQDKIIEVKI